MSVNKKERMNNAKFELHKMLDNTFLRGIPLLVVGNKIDMIDHLKEADIIERFSLDYLQGNEWAVIMASALKGTNMPQVLDWSNDKSKKA